jgi:hypothetical protein
MALKAGEVTDPIRQLSGFYIIRAEDKTTQSMMDVFDPIAAEIRQAHVNEWFAAIRTRFTAVIENPQFFARPPQGFPEAPGAPAPGPK